MNIAIKNTVGIVEDGFCLVCENYFYLGALFLNKIAVVFYVVNARESVLFITEKLSVCLKVKNIRYYKSQPWGFADNILVGYFCEADGNTDIVMDEEELSMAKWIKRSEIPINTESFSLTWEMINSLVDK